MPSPSSSKLRVTPFRSERMRTRPGDIAGLMATRQAVAANSLGVSMSRICERYTIEPGRPAPCRISWSYAVRVASTTSPTPAVSPLISVFFLPYLRRVVRVRGLGAASCGEGAGRRGRGSVVLVFVGDVAEERVAVGDRAVLVDVLGAVPLTEQCSRRGGLLAVADPGHAVRGLLDALPGGGQHHFLGQQLVADLVPHVAEAAVRIQALGDRVEQGSELFFIGFGRHASSTRGLTSR